MSPQKAQSAMEYLMTYGWAILIIAVVLAILYQLGIFGGSSALVGTSCLAATGYLCGAPQLNTAGNLVIQFGQIGQTITLTGIACTNNVSTPVNIQSVQAVPLASGQQTNIAFSCPLASNTIGTAFKGYLWLQYNTGTQNGNIREIGSVTAVASTTGTFSSGLTPAFSATCSGTLTIVAGNDICTFTSSGTFTVSGISGNVAVLVVAGGGSGDAGGGGAGGVIYSAPFSVSGQSYSVTVGAGGINPSGSGGADNKGHNGADSIFSTITAVGGGTSYYTLNPASGGSGGGGGRCGCSGAAGIDGQGRQGGAGTGSNGGGGGGAGAVGAAGTAGTGGAGGNGLQYSISGASTYYGGGGGGAASTTEGAGGLGGGGPGVYDGGGGNGIANTGGGGGGAYWDYPAGNGGSGVVIIAYNALGNGSP